MLQRPNQVLVIDDDEAAREILVELLGRVGFHAFAAPDGTAGLAWLAGAAVPPQAVLLDLRMPGLDGFEVLRRYRSEGGTAPVIALSAMDEKEAVVKAMRLGASDYLVKPIEPAELKEAIDRCSAATRSPPAEAAAHRRAPLVASHRNRAARRAGRLHRFQPGHDLHLGHGRPRRRGRRAGAHPRRERRGQGRHRAHAARAQPAARQAIREDQLRGAAQRAPRVGAVRARARRVHGSDQREAGKVRAGRPRDHLPRRDRRDATRAAGQASASIAGRGVLPRGRQADAARRRSGGGRDQPRARARDRAREFPRRPLLSIERSQRPGSPPARQEGRHPRIDRAVPPEVRQQVPAGRDAFLRRDDAAAARVRLSGKRARAGEPGAQAGGAARREVRAR